MSTARTEAQSQTQPHGQRPIKKARRVTPAANPAKPSAPGRPSIPDLLYKPTPIVSSAEEIAAATRTVKPLANQLDLLAAAEATATAGSSGNASGWRSGRDAALAYQAFLRSKIRRAEMCGFAARNLNPNLKDWQADLVEWFCRLGRPACFSFTGSGKSFLELSFCEQAIHHTGKDALILCPLAVASQTRDEAEKFGIGVDVHVCREASDVKRGINLLNYERLHKIDPKQFTIVSIDEASVLKHFASKTRNQIIKAFAHADYRFPATATPAPNDHMELGNQAEFCGWMTRTEMLATFFTHDGGDTSKWRLRKHAESVFWKWMASWSVMIRSPADLGYDDSEYRLPPLQYHEHVIETPPTAGMLFSAEAKTLNEQRQARRDTIEERAELVAKLANAGRGMGSQGAGGTGTAKEPWVVWCNLNDESALASKLIPDAVEVTGSQSLEEKEEKLRAFIRGEVRVLVSKASICGWGLNMQKCRNMNFLGISHSFEEYFQAIRRMWRFGQTLPVNVHITVSDRDHAVLDNIRRKEADYDRMMDGMIDAMKGESRRLIRDGAMDRMTYEPKAEMKLPEWVGAGR